MSTLADATGRPTRPPGRTTPGVALAALVVALVVGILGMHALASHDANTSPSASQTATQTAMQGSRDMADAPAAHEAMGADTSRDAGPDMAGSGVADPGTPGTEHGMSSMVMLCAMMLAAAAFTLLALLARHRLQPLRPAAFHPASALARARVAVRGTGPPPEWQFSVIRC